MIEVRKSEDRGHIDHGWLNTYHSFSFASYHDRKFMGFRNLRVINEDWVHPAQGFGAHSHNDMEIITYVIEGQLAHKDSMGNGSVINAGDVQYMSAGSGVTHSEFNHSESETVHLLQIWIYPDKKGLEPRYDQKPFPKKAKDNRLCLLVSPDGQEGSIAIRQDSKLSASVLAADQKLNLVLAKDRYGWLQIVRGNVRFNGHNLAAGDGAAVSDETKLTIVADGIEAELLWFDLN